jgi:hypothetical protein
MKVAARSVASSNFFVDRDPVSSLSLIWTSAALMQHTGQNQFPPRLTFNRSSK